MDNTNFQTIHQMGNAINNVVRQAMGRDNVQNIDMDYVTVAQRKRAVEETATGNPATFETNAITPMKLLIPLAPIQDLNGYDYPWPAGGGNNLVNPNDFTPSSAHVNLTIIGNEIRAIGDGEATYLNARITMGKKTYSSGTYYVKFKIKSGATINADTKMTLRNSNGVVRASTTITSETLEYSDTWTISENCYLTLILNGNTSGSEYATDITVYDIIISTTDVPFEPYSNICPISGWTGVNVTVSPTLNEQDGTTYSIAFPSSAGTVYGGTLTVNEDGTGTLVVDKGYTTVNDKTWEYDATYTRFRTAVSGIKRGSTRKIPFICSAFVSIDDGRAISDVPDNSIYAAGTSDAIYIKNTTYTDATLFKTTFADVQIVYPLETPVTYQLTNQQVIETLMGLNNVWSNTTGDITVMYKNYEEVI